MESSARAHCYRCDKPAFMCLCDRIERIDHRTAITILQHPRERTHPFGTARIARLGLGRCEIRVAHGEAALAQRRVSLPLTFEPGTAVLYPHPDAPTLDSLPVGERPSRLVVLDGTWSQAKRLWTDNPDLHALPCVRLEPESPSRYRIRREPSFEAISTLEAIVMALSILEPERGPALATLLSSLDAMIDDQLASRARRRAAPRRRLRRRVPGLPPALFAPIERLVIVGVEHRRSSPDHPAALARLSAFRPCDGELLDVMVGPTPSPARLAHLGVGAERFDHALDQPTALARLAGFLRPDDVVLTWHSLSQRLIAPAVGGRESVELKAVCCNLESRRCGTLHDLVARLELEVEPPRVEGRMGPWLANAASVTEWLRRVGPAVAARSDQNM